jgi:RHS repeat-associated protein
MKQTGTNPAEIYVYDAAGDLALEAGVSAPACKTCFVAVDALGSTRETADTTGTAVGCHDYLPFGEELAGVAGRTASCWSASDTTARFTGKERDTETANSAMPTGLDFFGARYFSGAQGRFISPDPEMSSAKLADPQTWNRYAYVTNNPLRYVDSDGRDRLEAAQDAAVRDYVAGRITQQQLRDRMVGTAPPGVAAVGAGAMVAGTAVAALPEELVGAAALGLYNLATRFFNSAAGQNTVQAMGDLATGSQTPGTSLIGLPVMSTEQSFAAAGKEVINGFEIYGSKQIVGNVFDRNIFSIGLEPGGSPSLKALGSLVSNLESQAKDAGSGVLRITGNAIHNSGFLNPQIAKRYGFAFNQIDKETVELVKEIR